MTAAALEATTLPRNARLPAGGLYGLLYIVVSSK
jgi:hypothetical protein